MGTRLTYYCAHLRSTKESLTFEYFDTERYWLVLDGTWSVEGGTGWYLMVLGHYRVLCQYRAVLVGT